MPIKVRFRLLEHMEVFVNDKYSNFNLNFNFNFNLVNFNFNSKLVKFGLGWLPASNFKSTVLGRSDELKGQ